MEWGVHKRGWKQELSQRVLGVGLLLILLFTSASIYFRRVSGDNGAAPTWKVTQETYLAVHHKLLELGYEPENSLGAVNNPPTFFVLTGRSSIVIPGGDLSQLLAVLCRYGAKYVVLERDQINLSLLYAHPTEIEALAYLGTVQGAHLLRLKDDAVTCRYFSQTGIDNYAILTPDLDTSEVDPGVRVAKGGDEHGDSGD